MHFTSIYYEYSISHLDTVLISSYLIDNCYYQLSLQYHDISSYPFYSYIMFISCRLIYLSLLFKRYQLFISKAAIHYSIYSIHILFISCYISCHTSYSYIILRITLYIMSYIIFLYHIYISCHILYFYIMLHIIFIYSLYIMSYIIFIYHI
jgi:hypothetical protein